MKFVTNLLNKKHVLAKLRAELHKRRAQESIT